jgi:hypothetical protein
MLNIKLGPQIGLVKGSSASFALTADLGYAIIKGNGRGIADGDLYVVASPEILVGNPFALLLGGGLQYDIPMPIRGLYIYPRAVIGAGVVVNPGAGSSGAAFVLYPAVGAKYVINKRVNLGVEPFGLPMTFGPTAASYQFNAYAGVNF